MMFKMIIASFLLVGASGVAMAKQAPVNIGNYSASVQSALDRDAGRVNTEARAKRDRSTMSIDRMTTASTSSQMGSLLDNRFNDDAYSN